MKQSKNKKIIPNIKPQPTVNILIKDLRTKETFKTISCDDRQQAEIFLNKGISFIEMGQFNSAAKELLEAEKYYPDDHRIHYFLGIAYHGKGMRDKAVEEFKQAISLLHI